MADPQEEATDATSIKPVSSLRSKFENLGQDKSTTPASPLQRTPLLRPGGQDGQISTLTRASLDFPRTATVTVAPSTPGSAKSAALTPGPRKRSKSPPKQRPLSAISYSPVQRTPPIFTVDSPRSPPKTYGSPVASATPVRSPALKSSPSPSRSTSPQRRFQLPGRATTASQETLRSALSDVSRSPRSTAGGNSPRLGDPRPKSMVSPVPPPVNRAGKPRVPASNVNQTLQGKHDGGETEANKASALLEKAISPFNTPPSSAEGTPGEHSSPPPIDLRSKPRLSEQLPARDSYFAPPPRHHSVIERRREHVPRIIERSPTLPAQKFVSPGLGISSDGSEDRPQLPVRGKKLSISGRTSPIRQQRIPARRSEDSLQKASTRVDTSFALPPQRAQTSALLQGFDRAATLPPPKPSPPVVPAPRRSVDLRRPTLPTAAPTLALSTTSGNTRADDYEDLPVSAAAGPMASASEFPDATRTNRRPPRFQYRPWEIATGYDTRLCAVCGDYVCTTGYVTRIWHIKTGESLLSLHHGEGVKVTSLVWKPAKDVADEGKRLWLGMNTGDIAELDISVKTIVHNKSDAHPRREIIRMYRYASELWTLDEEGKLHVWRPGASGTISLDANHQSFRVPKGHTFSLAVGHYLWIATGKDIRVFRPSAATDGDFHILQRPLCQEQAGDVTSGATISSRPDEVYFGHADGKVSIYNKHDYSCIGVINVSLYKINAMAGAGDYLWAGYNTGMAYVYDTSTTPWQVKKDWRAHETSITNILTDASSIWKLDRLQVVTLGTDNLLKIWDGMLSEDWLDSQMIKHEEAYCDFREVTAAVMTWNAGAAKPTHLRADKRDDNFFRDYLTSKEAPDFFVFGFQELVDLEDKKTTAKSFFKSKKKDVSEPEHMGHQYRAWRDHLTKCLDDHMPTSQSYAVLHTGSLVGLFTCIFVKSSLRSRIKNVNMSEVKRGMGGHYGNKGALIIRLVLDDSSICFVNCHLAAGQTQTIHRNNDIAAILESESLPPCLDLTDTFTGGGDGSMILDHEICILNGDLNYRIDAMTRDAVVKAVRDKNLSKLLDRDQLLLSRKKNPGFRLRLFHELPITFAPTYKYNVGMDEYDTSEKRRSPAWCDRLLYRGPGRVKCEDYRRWEVRVSDHRPVSARFKIRIKSMDPAKRAKIWQQTEKELGRFRNRIAREVKLDYLSNVLGLPKKEAMRLLQA